VNFHGPRSNSKLEIEARLGEAITTFAYPFAFPQNDRTFVQTFKNLLAETGYTCCATTELGRARSGDDPYRLKRLPINSFDDPALFRAKLEGSYDWLALPQSLIKRLKHSVRSSKFGLPLLNQVPLKALKRYNVKT